MQFMLILRRRVVAAKFLMLLTAITVGGTPLSSGAANAASTYSASAIAVLNLSATTGSLTDLLYLGSEVGYSAHVEANSNGLQDRTAVRDSRSFSGSPPPSFDGLSLAGIFPVPRLSLPTAPESKIEATAGGAHAEADNGSTFSGGNGGNFNVSTSGFATDAVESANSRSRLDLFVAFKNDSASDMILQWSVVFSLAAEAHADPRGSAFAAADIQAARGTFNDAGGRVFEPNNFAENVTACGFNHPECNLGETPDGLSGVQALFNQTLTPGETAFFNVELVAAGNALVVPVPAALPLFLSGLLGLGLMARRRQKQNMA